MKITISVLVTLVILFVFGLIFIYSGWYNVSALNEENGIVKWVLTTTSKNSIESHSKNISVPNLNDPVMIKEGFEHYNEMCVSCHGAPGKELAELSNVLNPPAPYLVKIVDKIDPKELFWVTKNGIKMTGMPAWGKTHSDETIWAIIAFMKKLPTMTSDEYEKMENGAVSMEDNNEQNSGKENHEHSNSDAHHHH